MEATEYTIIQNPPSNSTTFNIIQILTGTILLVDYWTSRTESLKIIGQMALSRPVRHKVHIWAEYQVRLLFLALLSFPQSHEIGNKVY